MKKLYLVVVELAVYGWSFNSADDAEKMALDWWKSEGEDVDSIQYRIMEFECPDCMTEDDFSGCSDYREYESVINAKMELLDAI